jgi:sugar phosphate permease
MGAAFPWIVHNYTWRHAWYFLGAGALVMVIGNALLLKSDPESSGYRPWGEKDDPSSPAPVVHASPATVSVSAVLRSRNFWIIGFSYFAVAYSLYGVTTFMVDYAKTQLGIPIEKASLLATIHGSAQVIGVLTLLPLSDYLGRKKTMIFMNSLIAASLFGIVLAGHSWGMLCFLVGLFAVFYGPTFPIYGACAGDYFPKSVIGTVIGAWTPFYGIGAILSHWVTGLIRDSTGLYNLAFLTNGVMALAGMVLILFVRKEPS